MTFFSMATSNAAVPANPLSLPPGQDTPVRPFADRDGRTYTIEALLTDGACNTTTLRTTVVVPHDRRPSNP